MSYSTIKKNLCAAERLALSGEPDKAHQLVRKCLALGMTPNDLQTNMSKAARATIKNHLMSNNALDAIRAMHKNGAINK